MKLTPKQQSFVDEYLIDRNGTQAAIRAGYSERTANEQASRLLANVNVKAVIGDRVADLNEKTTIDATYVRERLAEIDQMDVLDIMTDDLGIKPLKEWPKIWRQMISGIDVSKIGGDIAITLSKIKWPDKVKNLELIGKHVDVQAWRERSEVDLNAKIITISDADLIKATKKMIKDDNC